MGRELFVPADIRHGLRQAAEIVREYVPDIADAEGRGFRNLAGVNDEAPFLQGLVKLLKSKSSSGYRKDVMMGTGARPEARSEPAPAHSLHQRRMVFPVPGMAGFYAALLFQLLHGLKKARTHAWER